MNDNRLSASPNLVEDRTVLLSEIDKLVNRPSNYEIQEDGKGRFLYLPPLLSH